MHDPLPESRAFFERDALALAPDLLGCRLSRATAAGTVALIITEVEAYAGGDDPASHAFRGKTTRNATMFGPPGHIYCYFTYGMHHAINIVAGSSGVPHGCLIRAGRVEGGERLARSRREARARKHPLRDFELARGPGCVAQALGASLVNDGDDLLGGEWSLTLPAVRNAGARAQGPRVGVSGPGADPSRYPWRF